MNIDQEGLKSLKKAYKKSLSEEGDTFMWRGHKLVKGYAKYLIEYLENTFKGQEG